MDWNDVFFDPLQRFFAAVMEYLPLIVGVLVLLLLAWIISKVLRTLTRKLVRASGIDRRMGKGGDVRDKSQYPVANGAGTAVYWIVWVLFILAILQVLGVEGVFSSITVFFAKVFAAIPNILAAIIVLVAFYFLAVYAGRLVTRLLVKLKFNEAPVKMGLTPQPVEGAGSPAGIVGYIVMVFIMLFGIIMAADLLGFTMLNNLISSLTEFLAMVLLGVIIIGIGIFVANLVARILGAGGRSPAMITFIRLAIIILSVGIGLRAMGFANDIILLIFGLMLGATAVAAAIAFGFGGRKVAGKLLERWTKTGVPDIDKEEK